MRFLCGFLVCFLVNQTKYICINVFKCKQSCGVYNWAGVFSLSLFFLLTIPSCRATGWMSRDAPFLPHSRYAKQYCSNDAAIVSLWLQHILPCQTLWLLQYAVVWHYSKCCAALSCPAISFIQRELDSKPKCPMMLLFADSKGEIIAEKNSICQDIGLI